MDFAATRYLGRVRLLHDVLISAVSLLLAFPVGSWFEGDLSSTLDLRRQIGLLLVIVPIWALVLRLCRSDAPMRARERWQQVLVATKSVTLGVGLLATFLYLTRLVVVPRSVLFVFYALNLLFAVSSRLLVHEFLREIRSRGWSRRPSGQRRGKRRFICRRGTIPSPCCPSPRARTPCSRARKRRARRPSGWWPGWRMRWGRRSLPRRPCSSSTCRGLSFRRLPAVATYCFASPGCMRSVRSWSCTRVRR